MEYRKIVDLNYNVKQLKEICKHYKLTKSGSKPQLKFRVFNTQNLSIYYSGFQGFLSIPKTPYLASTRYLVLVALLVPEYFSLNASIKKYWKKNLCLIFYKPGKYGYGLAWLLFQLTVLYYCTATRFKATVLSL